MHAHALVGVSEPERVAELVKDRRTERRRGVATAVTLLIQTLPEEGAQ